MKYEDHPLGYMNSEVIKIYKDQYLLIDSPDSKILNELLHEEKQGFTENIQEIHEIGSLGVTCDRSISEFYLTFSKCEWLNGVTVCFGRIYPFEKPSESLEVLQELEQVFTLPGGRPNVQIRIRQCGQM